MEPAARYRLDDLLIDLQRQRVERDGERLNVAGLSFQLLRYLLAQGDRVVGFDELIEQVWAPAIVNEETVTQRVKLLRQALGDDGRQPRYLRSVRGQGYQLCVPPEPVAVEEPVAPQQKTKPARTRRFSPWILVPLLIVILAAAGSAWYAGRAHDDATPAATVSQVDALNERAAYYAGIGQRDDNERAIGLYQQVLQSAPRDVRARLGLSRAYSARVCLFNFPPQWAMRAQHLANEVAAAQPGNARAQSALGYAFDCRGRIDDALRHYERAYQLDPADDNSRASAAYLYERKGRLADAVIANHALRGDPARVRFLPLQIAANLDLLGYPHAAEERYRRSFALYPDNVFSNSAWPRFLFRHGRLSEADTALREALLRGTDHVDLHLLAAELALLRDDGAAAATACAAAVRLRPQASLPVTLARVQAGHVDPAWARQRADAMAEELEAGAGYPSDWLEVVVLREAGGDRAGALSALQRAVSAGYRDSDYLRVSPWFKSLSAEPEFARSIDAMQRRVEAERARIPPALLARITASP